MNYKYKFANENKTIEISEEWMSVLEELDRREYNNDHAETRRHVSLDSGEDGKWLSTERGEVFYRIAGQVFSRYDERFDDGRRSLSEKQDELYESIYGYGDSINDYAHDNGIDQSTASKRNIVVIKKFKKVFE